MNATTGIAVAEEPIGASGAEPVAEHALARIRGEAMTKLPEDLYIPPDALEIFLDAFEGPLDLLLYLIRKQNLDILDIPVLKITEQYMQYIALMSELKLELAAEYLLMAAWLAEIKSRILLPRPPVVEEEQGDPRMELVRRLQEYERFKTASENLDALPRAGRELFVARAAPERVDIERPLPQPSLRELLLALREAMVRAEFFTRHQVAREPLSVRERMSRILSRVGTQPMDFLELIELDEGRAGIVVSLLAILELVRSSIISLKQESPFAPLTLVRAGPVAPQDELEAIARAET